MGSMERTPTAGTHHLTRIAALAALGIFAI